MILLENVLTQYTNILTGKLIYISVDYNDCSQLYQDLIDTNILYYDDNKLTDVSKIEKSNLIRITSKTNRFSKFSKNIVHRRFEPTNRNRTHKYITNDIFSYRHSKFMIINYIYLLRSKKIQRLLELSK